MLGGNDWRVFMKCCMWIIDFRELMFVVVFGGVDEFEFGWVCLRYMFSVWWVKLLIKEIVLLCLGCFDYCFEREFSNFVMWVVEEMNCKLVCLLIMVVL